MVIPADYISVFVATAVAVSFMAFAFVITATGVGAIVITIVQIHGSRQEGEFRTRAVTWESHVRPF